MRPSAGSKQRANQNPVCTTSCGCTGPAQARVAKTTETDAGDTAKPVKNSFDFSSRITTSTRTTLSRNASDMILRWPALTILPRQPGAGRSPDSELASVALAAPPQSDAARGRCLPMRTAPSQTRPPNWPSPALRRQPNPSAGGCYRVGERLLPVVARQRLEASARPPPKKRHDYGGF